MWCIEISFTNTRGVFHQFAKLIICLNVLATVYLFHSVEEYFGLLKNPSFPQGEFWKTRNPGFEELTRIENPSLYLKKYQYWGIPVLEMSLETNSVLSKYPGL